MKTNYTLQVNIVRVLSLNFLQTRHITIEHFWKHSDMRKVFLFVHWSLLNHLVQLKNVFFCCCYVCIFICQILTRQSNLNVFNCFSYLRLDFLTYFHTSLLHNFEQVILMELISNFWDKSSGLVFKLIYSSQKCCWINAQGELTGVFIRSSPTIIVTKHQWWWALVS